VARQRHAVPLTGDANKAALLSKEVEVLGKNPAMRRDSTERKGRIKPAWMSSKLVSSRNGGDGIEAQAKASGSGGGVSYPSLLVTVGSVTNLPTGSTPTVTNTGVNDTAVLNFGLPQGPAGTVQVGTTTTGTAGTNASVAATGTPENRVLNFTIPRGDQGIQGIQGLTGNTGAVGPANTLAIGTVTAGPTAAASITGTAPNQTLNLTLQQSALLDSAKTTLTGNGTLRTFSVNGLKSSDPNHVIVAINGVTQEPTIDYLVNQGPSAFTRPLRSATPTITSTPSPSTPQAPSATTDCSSIPTSPPLALPPPWPSGSSPVPPFPPTEPSLPPPKQPMSRGLTGRPPPTHDDDHRIEHHPATGLEPVHDCPAR